MLTLLVASSLALVTVQAAQVQAAQVQRRAPISSVGTVVPGGPVAGTWTAAGSPYHVRGDLLVGDLVVEAGVEVRSAPGVEIRVEGSLTTQGTAAQPVLFTSSGPFTRWSTLHLAFTRGSSSLVHTRIERTAQSGLEIQDSPVTTIAHCEFVDNGGGGVFLTSGGDFLFTDCLFENNVRAKSNVADGAGLNALITGTLTLERCTVRGNRALATPCGYASGGGISVVNAAAVFMTDCVVEGNECRAATGLRPICSACNPSAAGGGIALGCAWSTTTCSPPLSFDATLTRCIVRDNRALGTIGAMGDCTSVDLHAEGGGIAYGGFANTLTLRNVILAGNVVWADGDTQTSEGAAVYFTGATFNATNCTFARNTAVDGQFVLGPSGALAPGLFLASGVSELRNSILYENLGCISFEPPSSAACAGTTFFVDPLQGPGAVNVGYSDVEGGQLGTGNLALPPLLAGVGTSYADLSIAPGSPCIDAGNPLAIYADTAFPPSLGGTRNDMGHNGGPLAGGWLPPSR